MKKIYSFLALVFLVGMTVPVYAQENPCATLGNPVFTLTENAGVCTAKFSIYVKNDVSNANPKSVSVEYWYKEDNPGPEPTNIAMKTCFLASTVPGGAIYSIDDFDYDCSKTLIYRVKQYTASSSNGLPKCQGGTCGIVLVLPLDIISFSANKQGQSVSLKWKAAKELIEDGESFGIERSTDARTFMNIGILSASSQISDYSFTDNPGTATRVFYRLALNNNTGGRKYSNVVSVALDAKGPKIEVPQNSGIVRLTMLGGAQGSILDMTGRSIQTFNVVGDFTSVVLKDFSPGTYMIRCVTRDGEVVTQKFIR